MKNDGFTLAELIAVIAILSILIALSAGVYFNVQKNILEYQYRSVITNIETRAEAYAFDLRTNEVLNVSVEYLIKEGYLFPDDDEYIYDPRDDKILNCHMIEIRFLDNGYVATFGGEQINDEGKCDDTTLITGKLEIFCNDRRCLEDEWYNNDVYLSISGITSAELAESSIEWTSLQGDYYQTARVFVNPENLVNTTYTAYVKNSEGNHRISTNIKIDKEKPIVYNERLDVSSTTWIAKNYLNFELSDKVGSGLSGYAIINNTDCASATYTSDTTGKYRIPVDNGTYYVCVKDNAGNIGSSASPIVVNNIDSTAPIITITESTEGASTSAIDISIKDSESGILAYKFSSGDEWIYLPSNLAEIKITHDYGESGTHYIYVKDAVGNESVKELSVSFVDNDVPEIEVTFDEEETDGDILLTINLNDVDSGVGYYQVTSTDATPSSWIHTQNGSVTYTIKQNGTYYIWAKDNVGNITHKTVNISNIIP